METSQTKQTKSIPLSEVAFDPSIYPRDSPDNVLISKYRDAVDHLPPIVIDRKNRIIDGYHRWQAMIAEGITECDFILFDSDNDRECLMESIRLNATHGKQLTQKEKKEIAVRLYIQGIADDEIRKIISISERTVRNYLYEVREKERDTRLQLIKDYWTKGLSIRNIAERVHLSKSQVENVVSTFGKVAEIGQSIEPMIRQSYLNYWESEERLHEKPNHLPLFAIETAIYFFTGRGDVVYDAGDSLDLWATCEKFNRRYVQKGKMNDVTSVDLIVLDYNWSEIGNAELLKDRIKNDIREIPVNELTRIVYTVSDPNWFQAGSPSFIAEIEGSITLQEIGYDHIDRWDVNFYGRNVTYETEPVVITTDDRPRAWQVYPIRVRYNCSEDIENYARENRKLIGVLQSIWLFKRRD